VDVRWQLRSGAGREFQVLMLQLTQCNDAECISAVCLESTSLNVHL